MASERIQRRIERLLDQIEHEADQQNWQLVLDLAKEVLGFAPDNGDARAFLGVAEERLSYTGGTEGTAIQPSSGPKAPGAVSTAVQQTSFANSRTLWQHLSQPLPGSASPPRGRVVVAALGISLVALLIVVLMWAGEDLFGKEASCPGGMMVYNPKCGSREAWELREQDRRIRELENQFR